MAKLLLGEYWWVKKTMIFNINNVKVLHLEPTTHCNAACPQCARYTADGITLNPDISYMDLKLTTIKEKLSIDFVKQLDKMFMCGVYGEPAANVNSIKIYDWFRDLNPQITLGMNTNGSLRNTQWWTELGQRLNRELDYCVFSIDGLADTNHIYRRKTDFNKIMDNVSAFIAAGGRAHWDMLVFKHNEHQVEECKALAKKLGFVAFRAKVSKRFINRPITGLESPEIYQPDIQYGDVVCHAMSENSIFMNYLGELKPCCFLGTEKYLISDFNNILSNWTQTCIKTCTVTNDKSNFGKQWYAEIYFK